MKKATAAVAANPADTKPSKSDAVSLLKADHRKVEQLFTRFEGIEEEAEKLKLVRQICTELIVHTKLEEELFYPACREADAENHLLDEAQVEHDGAKVLIGDLLRAKPGAEFYDAKVKTLSEYIAHHVGEEEMPRSGIFAKALKAGVDMAGLGQKLQARKTELMGEGEALTSQPPQPRSFQLPPSPRRLPKWPIGVPMTATATSAAASAATTTTDVMAVTNRLVVTRTAMTRAAPVAATTGAATIPPAATRTVTTVAASPVTTTAGVALSRVAVGRTRMTIIVAARATAVVMVGAGTETARVTVRLPERAGTTGGQTVPAHARTMTGAVRARDVIAAGMTKAASPATATTAAAPSRAAVGPTRMTITVADRAPAAVMVEGGMAIARATARLPAKDGKTAAQAARPALRTKTVAGQAVAEVMKAMAAGLAIPKDTVRRRVTAGATADINR